MTYFYVVLDANAGVSQSQDFASFDDAKAATAPLHPFDGANGGSIVPTLPDAVIDGYVSNGAEYQKGIFASRGCNRYAVIFSR